MASTSTIPTRAGNLPILPLLPELNETLAQKNSALLVAPPGAGKTTTVPLALRDAGWLDGKRIIMLEPRRIAARAAARRMAWILGEKTGDTVGFRVRNETVVSKHTRIEVVTEGILTRMIQSDPALEQYGLVVLDEFHERNLHGDVGLALALQSRELFREDLRILVMSATLDVQSVSKLLYDAPVLRSEGKSYRVEVKYLQTRPGQPLSAAVGAGIQRAVSATTGSVLVFLPGIGEILRAEEAIGGMDDFAPFAIHVLHSSVPLDQQDEAIRPDSTGRRKIILATSIAETSITIDDVTAVVDAGYSRVPRYSPRTGLTRLETVRVSKASADQRAGRAGRTAPGVCIRLWNEHENIGLLDRNLPEILESDLAPMLLDLAAAGVSDVQSLGWLDSPPPPQVAAAREMLFSFGAIDSKGNITKHGSAMIELSLHPRLAHMVLKARELSLLPLACDIAALLEERDIVKADGQSRDGEGNDVDLRTRVIMLNKSRGLLKTGRTLSTDVDRATVERVVREADRLRQTTRAGTSPSDERATGLLLAFAYPDRIALQRDPASSRFVMRNGAGVALPFSQALSGSEVIVAADLDGRKPESRIWMAAPLDTADLLTHFADEIEVESSHEWDEESRSVRLVRRERLGALVLRETSSAATNPEEAALVLADKIIESRLSILHWTDAARTLQQRVAFVRHHDKDAEYPELSDEWLVAHAQEWLPAHLQSSRSIADVRNIDLHSVLSSLVGWRMKQTLDEAAPTHVVLPNGQRAPIDYSDPDSPMIAVRLQSMFGVTETPRIFGGKVPLTVQLLSPAGRPVQVTRDLERFWKTSYHDVRKEMKGRYPKHKWPEKP